MSGIRSPDSADDVNAHSGDGFRRPNMHTIGIWSMRKCSAIDDPHSQWRDVVRVSHGSVDATHE